MRNSTEIMHGLHRAVGAPCRFHPAVDDAIAYRERGGDEPIARPGVFLELAYRVGKLAPDGVAQGHCLSGQARV
jgi:hypothetical protein